MTYLLCNWMLVPLDSLHLFYPSPPTHFHCFSPLATTRLFSVSKSVFYLFLFQSPHVDGIMWYLSFCVRLSSFSIILVKLHPCCYRWQDFILFYVWVVPLFIYSTSLYIHILLDIKVASISWLLQIIATKNIGVHTSLQIGVFAFSG